MAGIFISYRRDDAAGDAGRLYDRLREHFGAAQVFRDVDTIAPGEQFTLQIEDRLARCTVLVALISRRWRGEQESGASRLDDPHDFVRLEIATALRRGITVIPALLEGASMPRPEELPADLRPFMVHQAVELDIAHFHDDVTRLIGVLERHVRPDRAQQRVRRGVMIAVALAALLAATAAVLWLMRDDGAATVTLRTEQTMLTSPQVAALAVQRGYFSAQTNPDAAGFPAAYALVVQQGVTMVLDSTTGLLWLHAGARRPGGRGGALAYIAELNASRHAGFSDWRLPTLDEAMSLLRPEARNGYHIDASFDIANASMIWTADDAPPTSSNRARGWVVYFYDGIASSEPLDYGAHVRAVRTR